MAKAQDLNDRIRRATSWIDASDALKEGQRQESFIFLYLAFNAMYGKRQYQGTPTQVRGDLRAFRERVVRLQTLDTAQGGVLLGRAVAACRQDAEWLMADVFLHDGYWRGEMTELLEEMALERRGALTLLEEGRCGRFLDLVFQRITVLRNQVFHGCVTYGRTSKGADSLIRGLSVLRTLVPTFRDLLKRYGNQLTWEPVPYPRLGSPRHSELGRAT